MSADQRELGQTFLKRWKLYRSVFQLPALAIDEDVWRMLKISCKIVGQICHWLTCHLQ